jgi:DNA-binding response OmpR family regulator
MELNMSKRRILLVDDEVSFTRLLKLNLEQTDDYVVRVENWADRALAAAHEFEPDLVLLDVIMPRIIGSDVAARFREDAHLKATPIVFFTAALGRKTVQDQNGMVGGFPCITKPASVEEVIDRIEQHLPKKRAEQRPIRVDSTAVLFGSVRTSGLPQCATSF